MPLQMRVPNKPIISRGVMDQSPYLTKVIDGGILKRKPSLNHSGVEHLVPELSSASPTLYDEGTVNNTTSEVNLHTLDSKTTFQ